MAGADPEDRLHHRARHELAQPVGSEHRHGAVDALDRLFGHAIVRAVRESQQVARERGVARDDAGEFAARRFAVVDRTQQLRQQKGPARHEMRLRRRRCEIVSDLCRDAFMARWYAGRKLWRRQREAMQRDRDGGTVGRRRLPGRRLGRRRGCRRSSPAVCTGRGGIGRTPASHGGNERCSEQDKDSDRAGDEEVHRRQHTCRAAGPPSARGQMSFARAKRAMCSPARNASAWIVIVGCPRPDVTKLEPSQMKR